MTRSIEGPVATAQMMIRQPIERVFESLIEPSITSRFGSQRVVVPYQSENESVGIGKCMGFTQKSRSKR